MADEQATATATETPPAQETPTPQDWRELAPEDVKKDPALAGILANAQEKDLPALIKSFVHYERNKGRSLAVPGKDAKPEEVQAVKNRLYDAGILPRPPAKREDYGFTKPEQLPEGFAWNDELVNKFTTTLHKHGASKELGQEILGLYNEVMGSTSKQFEIDRDQGMTRLRQEFPDDFETRFEAAKRIGAGVFKSAGELEFYESLGLGNHPLFLGPLMRLAPMAMQDNSFMESLPDDGGQIPLEEARAEYAKIMTDKTHPMHEGYKRGDPKVKAHIDGLYKKAVGNQKLVIGGEPLIVKTE